MRFYNTASVLGGASLLALLYLSKISVFRMCLATCLLSRFSEKEVLHVPELEPTRNFSKPNTALVMRDVILHCHLLAYMNV